jgi:hypothetical protein
MKTAFRSSLFLLLATTTFAIPAQAEEVPPVVSAMFKNWEAQLRGTPAYDKIDTDSSGNVTISNLAADLETQDPGMSIRFSVGSIVLENVAAEANGLIAVGAAKFNNLKVEFDGPDNMDMLVEIPQSSAEEWYLIVPSDNPTPQQAFRASMGIARKISSGEFKVVVEGQTIAARGIEAAWNGDPVTGAGKTTMSLNDLVIPESALAIMDPSGQLKVLGYNDVTLNVTGDGELTTTESSFGVSGTFGFSGKDIAGFTFSYSASDFPMPIIAELQAAQKAGPLADFNMLMAQLMNVSLSSFQIRFEDASITKKLLPMIAKKQGMDEAAMVANAGAMMQIGLMHLKNQAFTDQVLGAVNAFLKDPKSFTVSLKPAAPVKVQQLMMLNPANPGAAIDVLGVSVTAND